MGTGEDGNQDFLDHVRLTDHDFAQLALHGGAGRAAKLHGFQMVGFFGWFNGWFFGWLR